MAQSAGGIGNRIEYKRKRKLLAVHCLKQTDKGELNDIILRQLRLVTPRHPLDRGVDLRIDAHGEPNLARHATVPRVPAPHCTKLVRNGIAFRVAAEVGVGLLAASNRLRLPGRRNPFVVGVHEPMHAELTLENLPFAGAIPLGLDGLYLKIGANTVRPPTLGHDWLLGDGMVRGRTCCSGRRDRPAPRPAILRSCSLKFRSACTAQGATHRPAACLMHWDGT